jgi:serine protease Do
MQQRVFRYFFVFYIYIFSNLTYGQSLPDFTPLVEKNSAAVVNISTSIKASKDRLPQDFNMPDIPENSPFYDFFKKYFGDIPEGHGPSQERSSLGSGFIISEDGYVITNHHVVKNADEIIVRLNDRREFIAELIGSDVRSDIAVLKVEGEKLPFLKLGDSSRVNVGEWVLAIGSPFGFDYSVTAGIISAIGRSLPNENYVPFIQTDVAINPGNSGGPLFNLDGEVIGVNSQIYSRTGGFMGLSFAVPVNVVENVYKQLKEKGRVSRGWLGVLIQDVTRELAESFDMDHPHGALIAKVLPDGPAEKGGIEVGDIIVKFNEEKVSFSSDLPPLVGSTPVGNTVSVDIIRRSKPKKIKIEILELPTNDEVIAKNSIDKADSSNNSLNIVAKDLTEGQKKEIEIYDHGILVEQISAGPAQKSGIRRGDIILLLDNIKIKDLTHFNELVKKLPKERSVSVLIQRRDGPVFLALKLDE